MVHHVLGPAYRENLSALCSSTLWICFPWPVSATQHQDEGATSPKPREVRREFLWLFYFGSYFIVVIFWADIWKHHCSGTNSVTSIMHLKYVIMCRIYTFSSWIHALGDFDISCSMFLCVMMHTDIVVVKKSDDDLQSTKKKQKHIFSITKLVVSAHVVIVWNHWHHGSVTVPSCHNRSKFVS